MSFRRSFGSVVFVVARFGGDAQHHVALREHADHTLLLDDEHRVHVVLLHQARGVVGIEDNEARVDADHLAVNAQHLRTHGVEGAHPDTVGFGTD